MRQSLALLALLCAAPVLAGEPYLVKDINPDFRSEDSKPDEFGSFGGWALFAATTPLEGRELWASNGTEAGTFLLADLCPGECSGNPRRLAVTPRGYFFTAVGDSGEELWVTQGTPASTIRLAEVQTFPFVGFRWTAFVESRGLLFFLSDDGEHGLELWRTDGTPAGTFLAADIRPGALDSEIREMWTFAGRVFFGANDGVTGPSLWASDGTPAGTRLFKDTEPGNSSDSEGPRWLRPTSRFLYFFTPSPRGRSLWRNDGTVRGTQIVAELTGQRSQVPISTSSLGNRLLFVAETDDRGQEVWASDGSRGGTRKITSFSEPLPFGFVGLIHPLLPLGNRLVFAADDGIHGRELWVTDGTARGTRLLVDILPGAGSGVIFLRQTYKGRLLFSGTDGRRGEELWTSDGTPQGTRMIRDICRGSCSSRTSILALLGDRLLLVADDGRNGPELWQTDGTAKGTVRLTAFAEPRPFEGAFRSATASGGLVFTARDAVHGEEVWGTDGTSAGTRLLADLNDANQAGSFPAAFMRLGNTLFFFAQDGQRGVGLWKSDGSGEGTTLVEIFNPDPEARPPATEGMEAGGLLFFTAEQEGSEFTIWRTDGTSAGTFELDLPGVESFGNLRTAGDKLFFVFRDESLLYSLGVSNGAQGGTRVIANSDWYALSLAPRELTSFQDKLFFFAGDDLWMSDGTAAGTVLVREFSREPINLTVHQGFLYFYGDGAEPTERALWRSDGTNAGTVRAAEMPSHFDGNQPLFTTSAGPLLFLWNLTVIGESGLWVSDGTTAGTRWVSPVYLAEPVFVPPAVLDGVAYFLGKPDNGEATLWRSDGTSAGTFPVLEAGPSSDFGSIITAGGLLFFTRSGFLWQSDGTAAGTFKVHDPDPAGYPFAVGPRVFFPAYDPTIGYELWAIDTRED